ncbi:hypothetical protein EWM64_g9887 [Hericium alpestre]|uniref:Alpha-type protein kinase domain-containing protein n=1 Tax=Hericium alpestre TaxID=135208 RepID=A0A4Y9ZI72_9AGAM|nr:hypothetical protein EWM64_g9887 [Hericium alpestre]
MPPVSLYSRASTHRAVHEITKAVKLVFASATVSLDGQADIQWPANGKVISAQICNELNIEGNLFIAKHFYDIGQGPSQLTPVNNYQNLHAELQHAIEGTHFLKKFYEHAEQLNQEVSKGFCFVEARLAKEIHDIDINEYPSKASGLGPDDVDDDTYNCGAYWLIEPCRNIAVKKWTGTMSHRLSGFGQEDKTLSAFVHFVWHYTNSSVVLADLQSTLIIGEQSGHTIHELFDYMTHTYEGNSGVGDHGEEGLQLPIVKHKNMQFVAAPSKHGNESKEEEGKIPDGVDDD